MACGCVVVVVVADDGNADLFVVVVLDNESLDDVIKILKSSRTGGI